MKIKNTIIKIAICVVLLIATFAIIIPQSPMINSDTLWHIKNGEWIMQNKAIPFKDYFSYHKNLNFIAHEWLFDVVIYWLSLSGTVAITLYGIITVIASYIYAIFRNGKSNQWMFNSIAIFLLTIAGFYKAIVSIPDTVGAVILVAMANNLLDEKRSFKNKLIVNSALSVFLSNFHGGMMSAAIIEILFLTGLPIAINWITSKKGKGYIKNCILLTSTSFIGSLINPYGFNVYKYGFMIKAEASQYIIDWQPFAFRSTISIFIVLILLGLAIYGSYLKHNKFVLDLKIATIFYYLVIMFSYQRAINIFTLGLIFIAGEYIYMAFIHLIEKCNIKRIKFFKILSIIGIGLLSIICILGGLPRMNFKNQSVKAYINESYISSEMQEYLKDKRIFNSIAMSGHLICLDIPVIIDGRADVYTKEYDNPEIFMECYKAMHSDELMIQLSKKYNFSVLVLESNSTVAQIFIASPYWKVIDMNQNTVILEKR